MLFLSRVMEAILDDPVTVLGVTKQSLLSKSRSLSSARARAVAMYVVRKLTAASYPEIGRAFQRDHTTIMAAVEKVEERLRAKDGSYTFLVARLTKVVESSEKEGGNRIFRVK